MIPPHRPRDYLVALSPRLVACPKCGVGRGSPCSSGRYTNGTVGLHSARRKLVAHLSGDEAYAQMTAMFDEQDQRQAEVRAQLAKPLTEEQQATRRAIETAWRKICADQRAEERDLRARCTGEPFPGVGVRTHADDCQCRVSGEVVYLKAWLEARNERLRLEGLRGQLPVTDLPKERARRRVTTLTSSRPTGGGVA